MASKIRLLEEHVANQIAAGEVIERPASVVKELVENALDAGAKRIEVEIQKGGKSLIRVTDDGSGMSEEDALLSLERHATSKIRKAEDLLAVKSFGFRGEALPSIASVCRFRLLTREKSASEGTEITAEGGKLTQVKKAGCAPGTMVEVRSLFSNLPARRKFLRTDPTEWAHIDQYLRLVALVQPNVHLTVQHKNKVQYPPTETLEERLKVVFGKRWVEDVTPINIERAGMRIRGFIGKPGVSRANRQEQILFINNRPVQNPTLNYALLEGYHNLLMKGRYPVAVLFIEVDPAEVDVNVHPSKKEVRFRNAQAVRQFVADAVADALRQKQQPHAPKPLATFTKPSFSPSGYVHSPRPSAGLSHQGFISQAPLEVQETFSEHEPPKNHALRIVGAILNLYIIAESREGLVLIDQHAAHERILFEKMLSQVQRNEVLSQRLLFPTTVELQPEQADFLRLQIKALEKIGLEISELGGTTFMIDALPSMIQTQEVEEFFREALAELQSAGGETSRKRRLSEDVIAKTVCRHAVKANDSLKREEMERLLTDLHDCGQPHTCPHGRPTMITISPAELEKKFGRVVG